MPTTTRELLLTLQNGDSPPLTLRRPVRVTFELPRLRFVARPGERYALAVGNRSAKRPRYDLAALPGLGEAAVAGRVAAGPLERNPAFSPEEPAKGAPAEGAAIDASRWRRSRGVTCAGTADPTPASYMWRVDLTAPDTAITFAPPVLASSQTATFLFSTPDGDVTGYECSIDGGVFLACTSPAVYAGLSEAAHHFEVRAKDMGGVDTRNRYHVHWGPAEQYAERREESALRRSGRPVPDRTFDPFEPIDLAPLDGSNPADAAEVIINELTRFSPSLAERERWLVLNKADMVMDDERDERVKEVVERLQWEGPVYVISAISKQGTVGKFLPR